jgi:hypothetical protein
MNVLVKAGVSEFITARPGILHWCYQHDVDHPDFAWIGFPRMVKPWDEWVFIVLPVLGYKLDVPLTHDQRMKRIWQIIGEETVDIEILNVSKWLVNNIWAEKDAKGNVFCRASSSSRQWARF